MTLKLTNVASLLLLVFIIFECCSADDLLAKQGIALKMSPVNDFHARVRRQGAVTTTTEPLNCMCPCACTTTTTTTTTTSTTSSTTSSAIPNQTTAAPNATCSADDVVVQIALSTASHSAGQSTSSCSVQRCNTSSAHCLNSSSSLTPCFDYRAANSTSYCAPGILCSLLEPCNNITYTCASSSFVCVVNSCCLLSTVCLPLALGNLCKPDNGTVSYG